jgi:hypothetical protein
VTHPVSRLGHVLVGLDTSHRRSWGLGVLGTSWQPPGQILALEAARERRVCQNKYKYICRVQTEPVPGRKVYQFYVIDISPTISLSTVLWTIRETIEKSCRILGPRGLRYELEAIRKTDFFGRESLPSVDPL